MLSHEMHGGPPIQPQFTPNANVHGHVAPGSNPMIFAAPGARLSQTSNNFYTIREFCWLFQITFYLQFFSRLTFLKLKYFFFRNGATVNTSTAALLHATCSFVRNATFQLWLFRPFAPYYNPTQQFTHPNYAQQFQQIPQAPQEVSFFISYFVPCLNLAGAADFCSCVNSSAKERKETFTDCGS